MILRVDVATGAAVLHETDLRLPGLMPLVLARTYRSDRAEAGPLGAGWHLNLDVSVEVTAERLAVHGLPVGPAEGGPVVFAPIAEGVQATHHETGLVLQHHPRVYVAYFSPLAAYVFPKGGAPGGRLRLGSVEDRGGNRITFVYREGRLAGLVDSAGRHVHLTYRAGRLTDLHLGQGSGAAAVRSLRYDGAGNLVAVRDAAGREAHYAYEDGLLVAYTNRLGGTHYAQYDDRRRCIARWHGDGSAVRRFDYDETQGVTRVQATDGLQTIYRSTNGRVVLRVGPEGEAQGYLYDERLRFMGHTDDEGELATLQRLDPDAGTLTVAAAGTRVWQATLGAHGLAETLTVGAFGPFALEYDERGHPVALTAPERGRWRLERSPRGLLQRVTTPEGRWAQLTHGPDGRTLAIAGPDGPRLRMCFDEAGRLTERHDALGRVTRHRYDPAGRLLAVALDGGAEVRFGYDPSGALVGVRDVDGVETTLRRDAFGRVTGQNGSGGTWQYGYDRDERLVAARAGTQVARLVYASGRLAGMTGPGGRPMPVGPPPEMSGTIVGLAGELLRWGDEEHATHFTYDDGGLLAAAARNAQRIELDRDADGLIVSVHAEEEGAPAWDLVVRRDGRGRPLELAVRPAPTEGAEESDAPASETVRLVYDAADRLTAVQRREHAPLTLSYDALDRPTAPAAPPGAAARHALTVVSGVVLVVGRRGVVLAVAGGGAEVPLWCQGTQPFGPPAEHDVLAQGADAVVGESAPPSPDAVLDAWERAADRWLYSEVPPPHLLGLVLPMGGWMLQRAVFDSAYPDLLPLHAPTHRPDPRRAPDDLVTGAHRTGGLKSFGPVPPPALLQAPTYADVPPLMTAPR